MNTRKKTCCSCGAVCRGEQWWNRDTGFGICPECVKREKKTTAEEVIISRYGVEGVHYELASDAITQ